MNTIPCPFYDENEPNYQATLNLYHDQVQNNDMYITKEVPESIEKVKESYNCKVIFEKASNYRCLSHLLAYHRSQGYKVVESFALTTALTSLSYLYSHSYEVGVSNISRKMPLNLFAALVANTGYEKTGYMRDCRNEIVQIINSVIHDKFLIDKNSFTTYLPSSAEGLQKICGIFPTRVFILDECKQYLKAKQPSPKYDVWEALRNMFDKHIFGLSVTKKSENDNKETDDCFATVLIAGTTEDMKKHMLSVEKIEDGTANRFLIAGPSSTRTASKKPVRFEKHEIESIFSFIKEQAAAHIQYKKIDCVEDSENKYAKAQRIIKQISSPEIEEYYEKVAEKNDILLDEYDENGSEADIKVVMLTRQMLIKKRIAYLLWIDSGFQNGLQCAIDAEFFVDELNKTAENLYEDRKPTTDILKTKIVSLKDKFKPHEKIYISNLTKKKAMLDLKVYANVLQDLDAYLKALASLNQIQLFMNDKRIVAFSFN